MDEPEQDPVVFQSLFHGMKDASSVFKTPSLAGNPTMGSHISSASTVASNGRWVPPGEEFIDRCRRLTHTFLDHPLVCAFCYTQLTDVEQEANGLYTYDRNHKFDPGILR